MGQKVNQKLPECKSLISKDPRSARVNTRMLNIHQDAFASGQIGSKIWLCEELERTGWASDLTWIYGGWYATTAFLLRARGRYQVGMIESFDLDPACAQAARLLNENWVWRGEFQAHTQDCDEITEVWADTIINTATEHFHSDLWWQRIPKGTRVVLQSNDMPHRDHVEHIRSVDEMLARYPLKEVCFAGSLDFDYPDWGFTRYMTIGVR